jgi:hypothetical protein
VPRRNWRPLSEVQLQQHFTTYPCPETCPARTRIQELFGVMTFDIVEERRTSGALIPLRSQMVNGKQMRAVIGDFLEHVRSSLQSGSFQQRTFLNRMLTERAAAFPGLLLGCIGDLCFNLEYVRRATGQRWAYCNEHGTPRAFYPYLGVCPYCITRADRPQQAALGTIADADSDDIEDRRRYFGNKIQSHHVGRIGERVFVFILDLISKAHDPNAATGVIFDDQHDIDAVFFFSGIGTLSQIKASPLVLLPLVVEFSAPLTAGNSVETGLPLERQNHSFFDLATADHELGLYLSITDQVTPLGPKDSDEWPYVSFRRALTESVALDLLQNWLSIYDSFAIPKRLRSGDDIKRAWLTCGWGAPIDDNKTKAGLARSDNMMKGTYACLKYGAYYVQECQRKTLRTALVSNIDPAHQYAEYLEKLEDIKWGHSRNFSEVPPTRPSEPLRQIIDADKLSYLFDSVFTFNRQILNDPVIRRAWDLTSFWNKLTSGQLGALIANLRGTDEAASQTRRRGTRNE